MPPTDDSAVTPNLEINEFGDRIPPDSHDDNIALLGTV